MNNELDEAMAWKEKQERDAIVKEVIDAMSDLVPDFGYPFTDVNTLQDQLRAKFKLGNNN